MIEIEFISLTRNQTVRKALGFWYKKMFGIITFEEFIKKCTWKKINKDFIITYRGSEPPRKNLK